jgi:hypothetical protein
VSDVCRLAKRTANGEEVNVLLHSGAVRTIEAAVSAARCEDMRVGTTEVDGRLWWTFDAIGLDEHVSVFVAFDEVPHVRRYFKLLELVSPAFPHNVSVNTQELLPVAEYIAHTKSYPYALLLVLGKNGSITVRSMDRAIQKTLNGIVESVEGGGPLKVYFNASLLADALKEAVKNRITNINLELSGPTTIARFRIGHNAWHYQMPLTSGDDCNDDEEEGEEEDKEDGAETEQVGEGVTR